MIVKLLTEHHLVFPRLKGGCRVSSESTHVKMPHCWKSYALVHLPLSTLSSLLVVPVVSLFFFTSFRRYCISGFVLGRLASILFALFESVLDLSIGLRSVNKVHAHTID